MTTEFKFGRSSTAKLDTGCPGIKLLASRALILSPYDFTVIRVWSGQEVQDILFKTGASTKAWPDSKHNIVDAEGNPYAEALDFGPWVARRIPWKDTHVFAIIAGSFFASAQLLGFKIRWGGDWDGDGSTRDQNLMDWGHIEIIL